MPYKDPERRRAYSRDRHFSNHEANLKKMRDRYQSDPMRVRDDRLRSMYGITLETYKTMFAEQGGVCKICCRSETALGPTGHVRPLAVDHDHTTKVVRGLLCHSCNIGIGHLPTEDLLERASKYLAGT
jgi:hypothetical protein